MVRKTYLAGVYSKRLGRCSASLSPVTSMDISTLNVSTRKSETLGIRNQVDPHDALLRLGQRDLLEGFDALHGGHLDLGGRRADQNAPAVVRERFRGARDVVFHEAEQVDAGGGVAVNVDPPGEVVVVEEVFDLDGLAVEQRAVGLAVPDLDGDHVVEGGRDAGHVERGLPLGVGVVPDSGGLDLEAAVADLDVRLEAAREYRPARAEVATADDVQVEDVEFVGQLWRADAARRPLAGVADVGQGGARRAVATDGLLEDWDIVSGSENSD
ncbi:LacI family transcriptional regulator [Babesia caballi]|uniref:LacI family transcriptional regulator n=1 Tax=Babesia caballi TaxID=5871 RepID=A0AAV4LXP6_BABCB|nr:LacI family transcriptional regulator [Babesia caballi]